MKNTPVLTSFCYQGVKPSNGTFIKLSSKGHQFTINLLNDILIPVVPHKAVAEVSKIGNL